MNVNLTPELEAFVRDKVSSGRYNSSSEVVRDALRLFEEQDRIREMKLELLRKEVQKGIDQLEAGEVSEMMMEEVKRLAREQLKGKSKPG